MDLDQRAGSARPKRTAAARVQRGRKLGDQRIETVVGLGYRYRETAAK